MDNATGKTGDTRPSRIHNPNDNPELNAFLLLADAMGNGGSPERFITEQEAAGQSQLVNSEMLPTKAYPDDAAYLAVGVTFGEPDPRDPLFRPAVLPEGWKRQGTDHNMHSKVVDQYGRERISVFYKAAFYDRRADMRLDTPVSYLRGLVWNDGGDPVLDDVWLTPAVAIETLTDLEQSEIDEAEEADGYAERLDREYWSGRAAEHRAEAAKYAAMRSRIEAAS
jgi:hypothetical protein